jgi:hypothetical protein
VADVTNKELASQLESIQTEIARTPETVAAIVHDAVNTHEIRIPHSGVTPETAQAQADRIDKLAETNAKLIELLDGPYEADWRGIPIHKPEKGLLARLGRIEAQTNGTSRLRLDPKVWVILASTFAATLYQLITK